MLDIKRSFIPNQEEVSILQILERKKSSCGQNGKKFLREGVEREREREMSHTEGENIIVYGEFSFDARKYPRPGVPADIIMITFLMHDEFLRGCARSLELAIKYFNGCKEYFYVYHSPDGVTRRYSAKEIIQMNSAVISRTAVRSPAEYLELIRPYSDVDRCYLSYMRSRNFFIGLLDAVVEAKEAHFQRREFSYRLQPPMELYGHYGRPIQGQIYSAYDLMEIYTYANYLKRHGIVKELPMPSFTRQFQEEVSARGMSRLYTTASIPTPSPTEALASILGGGDVGGGREEVTEIPPEKQTLGYKLRKIQEEKRRSASIQAPLSAPLATYSSARTSTMYDSKNVVSGAVAWSSKNNHISN